LPSHLDVVEIVIEPQQDTSDMVCIGQEQTDELASFKFHLTVMQIYENNY